jgi:hypothetical protein
LRLEIPFALGLIANRAKRIPSVLDLGPVRPVPEHREQTDNSASDKKSDNQLTHDQAISIRVLFAPP